MRRYLGFLQSPTDSGCQQLHTALINHPTQDMQHAPTLGELLKYKQLILHTASIDVTCRRRNNP